MSRDKTGIASRMENATKLSSHELAHLSPECIVATAAKPSFTLTQKFGIQMRDQTSANHQELQGPVNQVKTMHTHKRQQQS
jgi:hypothetical protein